jgi:signal peptidase II
VQAARGAALTQPAARALTFPRALLVLVGLLTVLLDAATKVVVVEELEGKRSIELLGGLVTLVVSRNSGAAFSFAQGATVLFTAIAVGVVVVIVRSLPKLRSTGWAITLGLLVGGATGNLVDRLARAPGVGRGAVVDFISVPHFASFNVADSAITIGAVLAVLLSVRGVELDGTRRAPAQAE